MLGAIVSELGKWRVVNPCKASEVKGDELKVALMLLNVEVGTVELGAVILLCNETIEDEMVGLVVILLVTDVGETNIEVEKSSPAAELLGVVGKGNEMEVDKLETEAGTSLVIIEDTSTEVENMRGLARLLTVIEEGFG